MCYDMRGTRYLARVRAKPENRMKLLRAAWLLALALLLAGCSLIPAPTGGAAARPSAQASQPSPAPTRAQPSPAPTRQPKATPTRGRASPPPARQPKATPTARAAEALPGFEAIAASELPREAQRTLALIAQGGPFPYRQDGAVFQNRERLLPRQPGGYYHEYTVATPGSDDRGARRIVTGAGGEIFYTDDHYDSFVQVLPA